jgi:hypothetical protein
MNEEEGEEELLLLLSDELLRLILDFVPSLELLRSTVHASKRFALQIQQKSFWQNHVPRSDITNCFTRHQLQCYCICEESARKNNTSDSTPTCLKTGSVLISRPKAREWLSPSEEGSNGRSRVVCIASTTDHANENLENVLPDPNDDVDTERFAPRERVALARGIFAFMIPPRERWWSSRPSHTQDKGERLLFSLKYPECIVSEVWIKPLRDPFHDEPVYTWKQTKIQAYHLPVKILGRSRRKIENDHSATTHGPSNHRISGEHSNATTTARDEDDPIQNDASPLQAAWEHPSSLSMSLVDLEQQENDGLIDAVLASRSPVYESDAYDVPRSDSNDLLRYPLPSSPGVVANVIVFTLTGKTFEQFQQSGYYACVERVDVRGIPLHTHRNVDDDTN